MLLGATPLPAPAMGPPPAASRPAPFPAETESLVAAAAAVPANPLDPLTAAEIRRIKTILTHAGIYSEKDLYSWVQLLEPDKNAENPDREAFVVSVSGARKTCFEIRVNLTKGQIVSQRALGKLQPFIAGSEYEMASDLLDGSSQVRAAIEARGIPLPGKVSERIYFDEYAPGRDAYTEGNPRRIMRILFADRQGGENNYGPYLEGLMAFVDLYNHRILSVTDTHGPTVTTKVPHDVFSGEVLGPLGFPLLVQPA